MKKRRGKRVLGRLTGKEERQLWRICQGAWQVMYEVRLPRTARTRQQRVRHAMRWMFLNGFAAAVASLGDDEEMAMAVLRMADKRGQAKRRLRVVPKPKVKRKPATVLHLVPRIAAKRQAGSA